VVHNIHRQSDNLRLYEFGRTYTQVDGQQGFEKFVEKRMMSMLVYGKKHGKTWNAAEQEVDYFFLKSFVENVIQRLGINPAACVQEPCNDMYLLGVTYKVGTTTILTMGMVKKEHLKRFDITKPVVYADLAWDEILRLSNAKLQFKELPRFFEVRRDLSLLIDETITFEQIRSLAEGIDKKLIKEVSIFDVYQGNGVAEGKKSYAVSFVLQDERETLKDNKIEELMNKLIKTFKEKLGAELR
jgi:phenylalanyl-tRNA synthetase beta chain